MNPTGLPLLLALGLAAAPLPAAGTPAAPGLENVPGGAPGGDGAALLASLSAAVSQRLGGAAPAGAAEGQLAQWSNWSNAQSSKCNLGNWRNC